MISAIIIPIVFFLIIFFIITGRKNRLQIAFAGAIMSIISLMFFDQTDTSLIIEFIIGKNFVNLHTVFFILGMMIIIAKCQEEGVFIYIAFKIVQKTGHNRYLLLFSLCFLTFTFSSFLNNILCIFLIIPLTITICKILDVNPIPYILAEAMVVNLGGLLFVISSIPNIIISHTINWTFFQYFIDVGIFAIILFVLTSTLLYGYNKYKLDIADKKRIEILIQYDAWTFVQNRVNFYKSLVVLIVSLVMIIALPIIFTIDIDIIALSGAAFVMVVLVNKKQFVEFWKSLDIELIFYLMCILFISEALEYTGVLKFLSDFINGVSGGNFLISLILILWLSAIISSFVHNAAVTKVLIPVVEDLTTLENQRDGFSALSIGTILGENLSIMGDNLVIITMTNNYGFKLKFSTFLKLGISITLLQLIAATFFLMMKINIHFFFIGLICLIALIFGIIFLISLTTYSAYVVNEKCDRCGLCVNSCPVNAISLNEDKLRIYQKICVGCGNCIKYCKHNAIEIKRYGPKNILVPPPTIKENGT